MGTFKGSDLSKELKKTGSQGFRNVFWSAGNICYCQQKNANLTPEWEVARLDGDFGRDPTFSPITMKTQLISSVYEDVEGTLWISTFDDGVHCYRDNVLVRHLDIKEGQSVTQDHEKNIWIASMKDGVYKVSPYYNRHTSYDISNFQNSGILAMCRNKNDGIWCTNGKTIFLVQNRVIFSSDFQPNESALNHISLVSGHSLIVGESGSYPYGLVNVSLDYSRKTIHVNEVRKTTEDKVMKWMAANRAGNRIYSFAYFNLISIDPLRLFLNSPKKNLGERIFNIYFNSYDQLVINAKRNYLYINDSLVICDDLSFLDNRIITGHLLLGEGAELINTEGDSLFILNEGQLYNFSSMMNYSFSQQVKHLAYHDPTLFIGTASNIYLCENPLSILLGQPAEIVPLDITFRNIHDIEWNDGLLYIASDDGLTAIPYNEMHRIEDFKPIPYFRSILVNEKEFRSNLQTIKVKGRNRIQFEFGSISYSSGPLTYSYMLEGEDEKWRAGTVTSVVYSNLPMGEYLFKLRTRKSTSEWSDPATVRVIIHAPLRRHPVFITFLSLVSMGIIIMVIVWRKNVRMRSREVEHQLVLLEQKALQSMMNPHFIFNSLGSIQNYLLQSKPAEAGLFLSQFARLIRQNLNSINSAVISIDEEVDRLKNYLDLEKLRMEDKFEYHLLIDDSLESDEVQIPSMIIQPFVENAIWHGIANMEGKGLVRVEFRMKNDKSLEIIIEDNGIGIKRSKEISTKGEKHLSLGMEMTRKRLDLLSKKYNVATSIDLSEKLPGAPNPGTRVVLVVPVAGD
jgi:hypothetical protein